MIRLLLSALGFVALVVVHSENWPQWRGPSFNGSSAERGLPADWSKTSNVVWSLGMPGPSASTPIVWDKLVFVSSVDTKNQWLVAMAIDRLSGKVLWQHKIAEGIRRDDRSNYSSPSPVTDGQRVIFFYSTGDLVSFDFAGNRLWSRNIQADYGTFAFLWTFSSSPLLWQDRLYVQVLQRDVAVSGRGRSDGPNDSYLLAIDPETGKTLWKEVRPSEAVAESRESFATPVPFLHAGRSEILLAGGDCLTGHDAATGKEIWRWGTWNPTRIGHWRLVPSPVAIRDVILACGPKGAPVFAIKAGGRGVLTESEVAWASRDQRVVTADVPTPLGYLGDFFVLSDVRKSLSRVDPVTGRVKWSLDTPGQAKYEASPTGADGRVYLVNFRGEVTVVDAEEGRVLRTIAMGDEGEDMVRSTLVVAHGRLFIRTNQKLYCIGAVQSGVRAGL